MRREAYNSSLSSADVGYAAVWGADADAEARAKAFIYAAAYSAERQYRELQGTWTQPANNTNRSASPRAAMSLELTYWRGEAAAAKVKADGEEAQLAGL